LCADQHAHDDRIVVGQRKLRSKTRSRNQLYNVSVTRSDPSEHPARSDTAPLISKQLGAPRLPCATARVTGLLWAQGVAFDLVMRNCQCGLEHSVVKLLDLALSR
jgi:hypothetical protein